MVNWPVSRETSFAPGLAATADASSYARKDACEVLKKDGPAVLKQYIDAAKPLPIRGLYSFDKFWTQVNKNRHGKTPANCQGSCAI